jgi:membrane-associated protease RseP (regulator of RpoE activity)
MAERRRPVERPVTDAPSRGPSPFERLWAELRNFKLPPLRDRLRIPAALRGADAHRLRSAVVLGVAMLLAAGAAYAAVSALRSNGTHSQTTRHRSSPPSSGSAWLGADTTFFPQAGAIVVNVVPGSPADTAGLVPGDVITEINGRPIQGPSDLQSALARMHVGQQVTIGYEQGPSAYTAQVTLQSRPSGP